MCSAFVVPYYPSSITTFNRVTILPQTRHPLPRIGIHRITIQSNHQPPSPKPEPSNSSSSSSSSSSKSSNPSTTLAGRIIVEIFSLIAGAALLLIVIGWRFSQLVSLNIWKAMIWLANVRQLGKWAMIKLSNSTSRKYRHLSISKLIQSTIRIISKTFNNITLKFNNPPIITVSTKNNNQSVIDQTTTSSSTSSSTTSTTTSTFQGRRLILLRHAKTLWEKHTDTPDHDRVLSKTGKEEARLVGTQLSKLGWYPDKILCSDAVRTVQTLSLLNLPEKESVNTTCTESLYYAVTGEEMASAVDETLSKSGFQNNTTLMIVCHNPGCEELIEQLTGVREHMATACAALIEWQTEDHQQDKEQPFQFVQHKQKWELVSVIRPRQLQDK